MRLYYVVYGDEDGRTAAMYVETDQPIQTALKALDLWEVYTYQEMDDADMGVVGDRGGGFGGDGLGVSRDPSLGVS